MLKIGGKHRNRRRKWTEIPGKSKSRTEVEIEIDGNAQNGKTREKGQEVTLILSPVFFLFIFSKGSNLTATERRLK